MIHAAGTAGSAGDAFGYFPRLYLGAIASHILDKTNQKTSRAEVIFEVRLNSLPLFRAK